MKKALNNIIVPTGYMGTGSSAVTDLINEFEGYSATNGSYEYVFLHCPDGIFDLEDKLLNGNNAFRSDEALHSFYKRMKELYSMPLWWVGNYKKNFDKDFLKLTREFIEELISFKPENFWYMQQRPSIRHFMGLSFKKVIYYLSLKKISLPVPVNYKPMWISLVTEAEFYNAAASYLEKCFSLLGGQEHHLILDQLLLPHNLWRMEHYFGDNVKCIVVDRDPRDLFIANKYLWSDNDIVPYPRNVQSFCDYYRRIRSMEKTFHNSNVYQLHFEDLVYHYEETTNELLRFIGLTSKHHIDKNKHFQPEKSIENTQLFTHPNFNEETAYITETLSEYLYPFPYYRKSALDKVF